MKIRRVELPPEAFQALSENDRGLLVLLGHILNDVSVLNKLLACTARIEAGPSWVVHTGSCQAFLFAKLLIGKLSEAWTAIQNGYFRTSSSRTYADLLPPPAAESLTELKSYFSRTNLIARVRNTFAFHYSFEHAKQPLPADVVSDELVLYLHQHTGNSLYQFSEYAMNRALLKVIDPTDPAAAMQRMLSELSTVVNWLNEFTQGLMIAILGRNVGLENLHKYSTDIDVPDAPFHTQVTIPFFIEFPPRDPSSQ